MKNDNYSILMSVYKNEKAENLRLAMNSMWMQSVLSNDFVLVCDGPLTNELDAVVEEMHNRYLTTLNIIRLKENSGLGNALNVGLKHCKNELVARMDSDDISKPDRCEKQLSIFHDHEEISICSGTVNEFSDSGDIIGKRELPITNEEICVFSRKRNPFNHPSVMFRKSAVIKAGGYNEEYHLFEDYYLWIRMLMNGERGMNTNEPILDMRTPTDLYMRRGGKRYAKDMLAFHAWMRKAGWSKTSDFLTGAIPHAMICVLPNEIRKRIYTKLHK